MECQATQKRHLSLIFVIKYLQFMQPSQETKIHSLMAAIGTERSSKEALMNSNDIFISCPFEDYSFNLSM